MKKSLLYTFIIVMVLSLTNASFGAPDNVSAGVKTLNVLGVNKAVNVVTIDLNSSDIEVEVATANDRVSGSENFKTMINRKNPIAAINANFFDAYKSLEPYGSIMKNKRLTYLEGENTSLMISGKNKLSIDRFKTTIDGQLNGNKENSWNNITQQMDYNVFSIWYVNNLPTDSTGVYLFTPDRGESILLNGGTVIEIIGDKITKTTKSALQTSIPVNGYLIYYGKDAATDEYISQRFKIGSTVELSFNGLPVELIIENVNVQAAEIDLNKVDDMISAGPFLVNNGIVITDYITQGFKESKILTGAAQRSALGLTKDNKLILVTGSNLTMSQLAHIMKNLNCDKAMNLDGGASSGLYAKGKIITTPGRKLNTVLMIYDRVK